MDERSSSTKQQEKTDRSLQQDNDQSQAATTGDAPPTYITVNIEENGQISVSRSSDIGSVSEHDSVRVIRVIQQSDDVIRTRDEDADDQQHLAENEPDDIGTEINEAQAATQGLLAAESHDPSVDQSHAATQEGRVIAQRIEGAEFDNVAYQYRLDENGLIQPQNEAQTPDYLRQCIEAQIKAHLQSQQATRRDENCSVVGGDLNSGQMNVEYATETVSNSEAAQMHSFNAQILEHTPTTHDNKILEHTANKPVNFESLNVTQRPSNVVTGDVCDSALTKYSRKADISVNKGIANSQTESTGPRVDATPPQAPPPLIASPLPPLTSNAQHNASTPSQSTTPSITSAKDNESQATEINDLAALSTTSQKLVQNLTESRRQQEVRYATLAEQNYAQNIAEFK